MPSVDNGCTSSSGCSGEAQTGDQQGLCKCRIFWRRLYHVNTRSCRWSEHLSQIAAAKPVQNLAFMLEGWQRQAKY